MKIVFFGTTLFSATILQHLLQAKYRVIGVVTRQDRPQGRSLKLQAPPLKEWVLTQAPHIPLYQPLKASAPEFIAQMKALHADLFVVAAYGQILKEELLHAARLGSINIHASLLPKWRGAAPIQRSLMAGEAVTGVTIMRMVAELDAGAMLDKERVTVPPDMTHGALEALLAEKAKAPLLRVIDQLARGEAVTGEEQNASEATFAPKVTSLETPIDWDKSAEAICNHVRALAPEPGAWTYVMVGGEKKKMKVWRAERGEAAQVAPKQTVSLTPHAWVVGCGAGESVSLVEVQVEGKRMLSIADFLRGVRLPQIV